MWYLKPFLKEFSLRNKTKRHQFFVKPSVDSGFLDQLDSYCEGDMPSTFHMIDTEPGRDVIKVISDNKNYLFKRNTYKHYNSMFKITLGLKKSYGYPGLTNEFINSFAVNQKVNFIPQVLGFGYRRNKFGLVEEEYILFDFIENCRDVDEYLKSEDYDNFQLLTIISDAFCALVDAGFVHLSPHTRNFMLPRDLSACWMIDVETCALQVYSREAALGFFYGVFYRNWGYEYFSSDAFDQYVNKQAVHKHQVQDVDYFIGVYRLFRDEKISRKQRYAYFTDKKEYELMCNKVKNN